MLKISSIFFLLLLVACNQGKELPTIQNLETGESVTIQGYNGHMLSPGSRSDVGFAYRFAKVEEGFKIYELDPYSTNVLEAIQDSSSLGNETVYPIGKMISYYRNLSEDGSCDATTNIEITWEKSNQTLKETYSDDTCSFDKKFETSPIMPALWKSGLKEKR